MLISIVRGLAFASFASLAFAVPLACAQSYRCNAGGTTYLSDRPCGGESNRTRIGIYGPSRAAPATPYSSQVPDAPRAQEHIKYLPSGCASIVEAIRTAPTRGARSEVVRGLQEEYDQKCQLEDQEARNQLRQEKTQQQQRKLAERDGAQRERQQAALRADQCANMRDVIALKRKRESQLNGKEVEALRELEKSFNDRCIAR